MRSVLFTILSVSAAASADLFSLVVEDGESINACGGFLNVGGETCTHCVHAPPAFDCGTYQNQTVLSINGKMGASLPGEQYWFIDSETGALSVTAGGRGNNPADIPDGSDQAVIDDDGNFLDVNGDAWLACEEDDGSRRLFAPSSDVGDKECEEVGITAEAVEDVRDGAYVYN